MNLHKELESEVKNLEKRIMTKVNSDVVRDLNVQKKAMNEEFKINVAEEGKGLDNKLQEMKQELEIKLKTYVAAVDHNIVIDGAALKNPGSSGDVSTLVENLVNEKLKEEDEKKARSNGLVIFGLIEIDGLDSKARSECDMKKVVDLLTYTT